MNHCGRLARSLFEERGKPVLHGPLRRGAHDDVFARLLTFPNVLITAHQSFLTREALAAIAATTLSNLTDLENGRTCPNQIS